ncbi:MAG: hypothetical protein ABIO55_07720 [Ginsengibacter sp.]
MHVLVLLTNGSKLVMTMAQCSFPNNKKGFGSLILWVVKNTKQEIPAVYLMEATGIYYEQLAWFLHNKNYSVSVVGMCFSSTVILPLECQPNFRLA